MRQWLLVSPVVVALAAIAWILYMNRSSEKLVGTSLSLILAASIAAILNVIVFAQGTEDTVEFPVSVRVRQDVGAPVELPYQFYTGPQMYRRIVTTFLKTTPKEALAALKLTDSQGAWKFYAQALQVQVLELLQLQYGFGWKVKTFSFRLPTEEHTRWQADVTAGGTKLSYEQVQSVLLRGNVLAKVDRTKLTGAMELVLPPDVAASSELDFDEPRREPLRASILFESRMLSLRIVIEPIGQMSGLGPYNAVIGMSQDDAQREFATLMYAVKITTTTSRYYQGNPKLPALRSWARQVTELLRDSLDSHVEWQKIKEKLEMERLLGKPAR